MKRYIRCATTLHKGSYMLSKDGDITEVYFHAPSTTYIDRKIYHLCPTDANFLLNEHKISKDDADIILKACFAEYLESQNMEADHAITDSDIDKFAKYADLTGAPIMYQMALDCEGQSVEDLLSESESFESLDNKWYKWLKNNYVKVSISNNLTEFRIGSDNGYDWNDNIIDDFILDSNLKDDANMRYNILRESGNGYKAYFQKATLNDLLENDKTILSTTTISGQKFADELELDDELEEVYMTNIYVYDDDAEEIEEIANDAALGTEDVVEAMLDYFRQNPGLLDEYL